MTKKSKPYAFGKKATASAKANNAMEALEDYLLRHESDIATGVNDFGDLEQVFMGCMGRKPQWINPRVKVIQ